MLFDWFLVIILLKRERLFSLLVHLDDLLGTDSRDGLHIRSDILVRRIGYKTSQDITLEEIIVSILCLEHDILAGQTLTGFHIIVNLIVQTAF